MNSVDKTVVTRIFQQFSACLYTILSLIFRQIKWDFSTTPVDLSNSVKITNNLCLQNIDFCRQSPSTGLRIGFDGITDGFSIHRNMATRTWLISEVCPSLNFLNHFCAVRIKTSSPFTSHIYFAASAALNSCFQ